MTTPIYIPGSLRQAYARAPLLLDHSHHRRIVNGTAFHAATPVELVAVVEHVRANRFRIRLDYGDTATGRSWGETSDSVGYISRSTGEIKIPLLVRTARSAAGEALLDHCVLAMAHSNRRHGGVLYTARPLVPPEWPVQPLPYRIPDVYDRDTGRYTVQVALCFECKRYWNDAEPTSMTPTPAGRCPFEPFHSFAT
jgi:hypothetical protein